MIDRRRGRTCSSVAAVASLVWLIATVSACFDAPQQDVLFACDPVEAPACPDNYECRDDGCCHHVDTANDVAVGDCGLLPPAGDTGSTGTSTAGDTSATGTSTAGARAPALRPSPRRDADHGPSRAR